MPSIIGETICSRIRDLRDRAGYTQADFAKRIGVHKSVVNNWENLKRVPTHDNLVGIAHHFGVNMNYLYGFSDEYLSLDGLSAQDIDVLKTLQLHLIDLQK